MGLQDALGFRFRRPNPAQRGMQFLGASKPGAWVLQRTLYRLDRPLHDWSNGRLTLPGILTGLPVVMLTTRGAKSGLERSMPVAAIPLGDDLVVLGTNYGQERTPGWVFNLLAEPRCSVTWRDSRVPARAERVDPQDMEAVWAAAERVYVGFPRYRARVGGSRDIRAFRLVVDDASGPPTTTVRSSPGA